MTVQRLFLGDMGWSCASHQGRNENGRQFERSGDDAGGAAQDIHMGGRRSSGSPPAGCGDSGGCQDGATAVRAFRLLPVTEEITDVSQMTAAVETFRPRTWAMMEWIGRICLVSSAFA